MNKPNTHPIDLVDRVRLKLAFISSFDGLDLTKDAESGFFFLMLDLEDQLQEAVNRLNEMPFCTCAGCKSGCPDK